MRDEEVCDDDATLLIAYLYLWTRFYVAVRCLCRFSAHLLVAGQYGIAIAIATAIETWWCTGMRKCELFLGFDQLSSSQRSSAQRSSFVPIIDASSGHIAYIYIYMYISPYISYFRIHMYVYMYVPVCVWRSTDIGSQTVGMTDLSAG